MKKPKKKPLREGTQVIADETTYNVILHGRSRKRLIISYFYWDCTGGLKGWEPYSIYDHTFETEEEAREVFEHYQIPENIIALRNEVEARWRK